MGSTNIYTVEVRLEAMNKIRKNYLRLFLKTAPSMIMIKKWVKKGNPFQWSFQTINDYVLNWPLY